VPRPLCCLSICLIWSVAICAADKRPPPATAVPAQKNAVVTINGAKVTLTRNADNTITVTAEGDYNYKTDYDFVELVVQCLVKNPNPNNPRPVPVGPAVTFKPENTVAAPPKWKATTDLPDQFNNTTIIISATITVKKPATDTDPAKIEVRSDDANRLVPDQKESNQQ